MNFGKSNCADDWVSKISSFWAVIKQTLNQVLVFIYFCYIHFFVNSFPISFLNSNDVTKICFEPFVFELKSRVYNKKICAMKN